jgi:Xaa-Pro dipeptidase
MIDRRIFLKSAAVSSLLPAAYGVFHQSDAFAQTEKPTEKSALSPAIAALKNRKDEARPISPAERGERQQRARELMSDYKIDAVLMAGGTSLRYFTGIGWGNSERFSGFVLPRKGDAFCIAPAFEEERLREQMKLFPDGDRVRILIWQEDDDPYPLVARGLRDAGLATGTIGIEERTMFVYVDGVAKASPGFTLTSATPVTAGCRSIKSAHELALMTLANQVTLAAYEAAWKSIHDGATTHDLTDLIMRAYAQQGFPQGYASVQTGEFTALPHGSMQPQVIREGSVVMIDDGCVAEGYQADITRTLVLGKPTDRMKSVFEVVHKAQAAALAAARPGVECQSIDAAARKVIDDAGFGPGYAHFTHRAGHGIGMDMHEWPYLVKGNRQKITARMTFSDEPGIYLRGEFGVRLEDDMHITENGAELFTPQSPSLEDPFGQA